MGKSIRITIDDQSRVVADFVGFPGESCVDERQRLISALQQHGVSLSMVARSAKAADDSIPDEIRREQAL
jgi:hypothetical protein